MPVELNEFVLAKLAREVVMNIRPFPVILADFGLDENGFYEISKNDFYKRAEEQFALEWNSALTVNERVKLISAAMLEQALPTLGKRMTGDEPLAAAAEVAKLFSKNAGLGEVKTDAKSSERFQITINLGAAHKEVYDKAIALAEQTLPAQLTLEEAKNGEEKLDGRSRKETRSAAPLAGRADGGEDPGGKDRESRPLVEPDAAPAGSAGEDVCQAPSLTLPPRKPTPSENNRRRNRQYYEAAKARICTVEGCEKNQVACGLCRNHYQADLAERRKKAGLIKVGGRY